MTMLLTSAGLTNDSLKQEFIKLTSKQNPTLAFISTAAELEEDQSWVDADRQQIKSTGASIVELPLSQLPPAKVAQIYHSADVIWFNGGNTYYALYWAIKSGLADLLASPQDKLYVGVSAGSMIMGNTVSLNKDFFATEESLLQNQDIAQAVQKRPGLAHIPFAILPHYLTTMPYFPHLQNAAKLKSAASHLIYPILALGDGRAIMIANHEYQLIGQGPWTTYNHLPTKIIIVD